MTKRAVGCALLLAIAVGGCGSDGDATRAPRVPGPTGALDGATHAYPPFVRENFLVNCMGRAVSELAAGRAQAVCRCMYSALRQRYTLREFLAMDRSAALGHPLPRAFYRLLETHCTHPPPA